MLKSFFDNYKGHIYAFLAFMIIILFYFSPLFSGKSLVQSDLIQLKGPAEEVREFREKGEAILWTNKQFSGMPYWQSTPYNLFNLMAKGFRKVIPEPALLMMIYGFVGFYILLLNFTKNPIILFFGATGFVLCSNNIISLEAGHNNKVFDMMLMAPVIGGVLFSLRGKQVLGFTITFLSLGVHLLYQHIQISYYTFITILIIFLVDSIFKVREKKWKKIGLSALTLFFAASLAIGSNIVALMSNYNYGKSSNRGGSELVEKKERGGGLDKEYALSWSYGKSEVLTVLVPYLYGGSSTEQLDRDSKFYEFLKDKGVDRAALNSFIERVPLYWGDQPFTAGPVYFGVIIIFFAVFALFVTSIKIRVYAIFLIILSFLLSMGKNLEWFTDIFFYYVPLYNKFRSVTMIIIIAQIMFAVLAVIGLNKLFQENDPLVTYKKELTYSSLIVGGLLLLLLLSGSAFLDFTGSNDSRMQPVLVEALQLERESKLKSDSLRGLFFLAVALSVVYFYSKNKLSRNISLGVLALACVIDLITVDLRYLSHDDFKKQKNVENQYFNKSIADKQVLADTSGYYRVFNLTVGNPFSDGITSYHHNSVGGYSAIKLARYQDLIERHLSKNNKKVLDMLNARYIIVDEDKRQGPVAKKNRGALGNAWLVGDYQLVPDANAEIEALNDFNPGTTAVVQDQFSSMLKYSPEQLESRGEIALTSYHPEKMVYQSSSEGKSLAVFSEIYYQPGWQAYIDGKPVNHFKVNYVLRGMIVPEGEHEIVFEFDPPSYAYGVPVGFSVSILGIVISIILLFINYRKLPKNKED